MRDSFLRFEKILNRIISVVTSTLLAIAAGLGLLQVLSRFLFRFPFEWTEVLIRISLHWMVFVGVALVFRSGSMITVDMFRRLLPQGAKRGHESFVLVVVLGFLALLGWWGVDYARRGGSQTIIGLESLGITMFWAYLAIPVGCVLAAIAAIAHFVEPRVAAEAEEREELEQLEHTI